VRDPNQIDPLERYLPRRAAEWHLDAPGQLWQRIDGALCFVDISGFTQLTEKLSQRGRIGAEELTAVLNEVFGSMLRLADKRGGSLVRFAGDALLLMFEGTDCEMQAASAAVEMRRSLRDSSQIETSVGSIGLRMSVGLHAGPVDLYLVGSSHQELAIVGETAATTFELEAAAGAGEILISDELAARLPAGSARERKGPGLLLRWRKARVPASGQVARRPVDPATVAARIAPALQEYLSEDDSDSEHRIATVGFVKYGGIRAALEAGGQDKVASLLREFMGMVQDAADAEKVTFLNADSDTDGGKVALIAGVPVTHEDDEGRMLRTARRIIEANHELPIQIGISRGHLFTAHIGTAFRSAFTVMGDTMNLAARLASAAAEGTIVASPEVVDRSRTLFDRAELERLSVKGKSAPIPVCSVGPELGQRTAPEVGVLPFVGRAREMADIGEAVRRLEDGQGSVIAITGAAGFGKTRLLREALAASSVDRLVIRADPTGVDNPYWALRDPLRRLLGIDRRSQTDMAQELTRVVERLAPTLVAKLPLIGDALHITIPDIPETARIDPQFRRPQTEAAVVALLGEVADGPLAVIAEDHQWMDEASASLLIRLGRETQERAWLVVATSRTGLVEALRHVDTSIHLGPLSEGEARGLVVAATEAAPLRPHDLESILARGAGNPFFLGEIVRSARDTGTVGDLPEALDVLVRTRIDRLGAVPRQVLYHASVLGRTFRSIVLGELLATEDLSLTATTWTALAGYLERDGDTRLRFRDALVRDVAYEGLSYRRRRALHARAATAIEGLAGVDREAVAEPLALHYSLAGDYEGAWRYGVMAGDKARESYSNAEAVAQYRRALEAAARLGSIDRDALRDTRTSLADVLEKAGMFEDARNALGTALTLVGDDVVIRADLLLRRARIWTMSGSFANAKRNISLGEKLLDPNGSPRQRRAAARLHSWRASIAMGEGRPEAALVAAERAAQEAAAAHDEDALARAYVAKDWAHHMMGQSELASHGDQALEIFERLGQLESASDVMNNKGGYAYFAGQWDEAVSWYRRSQETSQRAGDVVRAAMDGANAAEVLIGQRRYDEAAIELNEARRVLRAAGAYPYLGFVEMQLARLDVATGNTNEAIAKLESLRAALLEAGDKLELLEVEIHLTNALTQENRPDEALELIGIAEKAAGSASDFFAAAIARVGSQALWALGDVEAASAEAVAGLSAAVQAAQPYEEALLREWRIRMAAASGVEADSVDLHRADELLRRLGIEAEPAEQPPAIQS
jgi:class 3 adenylate cyclase/tetratricopeptide (TPR) repeat protein